jgi:hypothetical protein
MQNPLLITISGIAICLLSLIRPAIVQDVHGTPLGYIPLTNNPNNALHDLWHAEDITDKVFWADQICIDQAMTKRGAIR